MKQNYFKTLLVTLLTMIVAMNASAETETYYSEGFEWSSQVSADTKGWTIESGSYVKNGSGQKHTGNYSLQVGSSNSPVSKIVSPVLSKNGSISSNVVVTLWFYLNNTEGTLTISSVGDATINSITPSNTNQVTCILENGVATVTATKKAFYMLTINMSNCDVNTKLRFATTKVTYIDDILVTGDADSRTPVTLSYSETSFTTPTESGEIVDAPTLTVDPEAAAQYVVFSSSNTDAAYFDEDGKLIAVAPGTTTITASISGNETYRDASASYTLKVGLPSSNLNYNPTSVTVTYDKKDNFTAPTLSFANGYNGTITYTSSNTYVATVDNEGKVEIHAVGEAIITASGAATQYLKASEASFTLTVNDIQGSATGGGNGESLFKETFDNADSDGGNDGAFSKASNQQMNKDEVCDNIGWSGVMYKANKCVKTGTSSSTGSVTTPEISVEPNSPYSLSFKAAPWGTESNVMKVTVTGGTIGEGDIPTTNMTTGQWNEFTTTITPTSSTIKITFSVTGGKRFFLDEINVVAPATDNTVQVTIPSSGWGTYCCQWPLDFIAASAPEGLKAYAVSSTSTSNATLTEITEKIIGGTGIIINGTPGTTYTINVADQGAAYSGTNLLTGTLAPTYVEEGQYFLKSGKFVYSSAGTLPANKAYLKSANAPEAAANLGFVVEESTGISEVLNNISLDDDKWYDLSGRVVSPTSKGIYIHNGKKYIIK